MSGWMEKKEGKLETRKGGGGREVGMKTVREISQSLAVRCCSPLLTHLQA